MNKLAIIVTMVWAGVAVAQSTPLPPQSIQVSLSAERFGAPAVDVALALPGTPVEGTAAWQGMAPLVVARVDPSVLSTGLGLGVQGQKDVVAGAIFVRGVASVMPTVVARGPVVGAVVSRVQGLVGFHFADVDMVFGPRVTPVFTFDAPAEGRVGIDVIVGVRVPLLLVNALPMAVVGDVAGGYDVGGHGPGSLSGAMSVGIQVSAPR